MKQLMLLVSPLSVILGYGEMSFLLTSSRLNPSSGILPLNSDFHSVPASPRLVALQTWESIILRPQLLHSLPLANPHQTLRCTEQARMCCIIKLQSVLNSSTIRITFLTLVPTLVQEVQVHLQLVVGGEQNVDIKVK